MALLEIHGGSAAFRSQVVGGFAKAVGRLDVTPLWLHKGFAEAPRDLSSVLQLS